MRLEQRITRWGAFIEANAGPEGGVDLAEVLNCLGSGVALVDEKTRVLFHNAALARMTQEKCGLRIWGGQLRAENQRDNASLKAAIDRCIARTDSHGESAVVPLRGSDRFYPTVVSVLPVPQHTVHDRTGSQAVALVVVVDTEPAVGLDAGFLRDAFQLSLAEAHVAIRLLEGETLSEIADARGITLHTARTQLKSIMSKTGISRQSELVNLLSRCDTALRTAH